jgi:ABC-type polysaccharide/polyol phosphate transport system ATPase subunit
MAGITLENVSVAFPIRGAPRPGRVGGLLRRLRGAYGGQRPNKSATVLSNIWLSLKRGDSLAILGHNGAGKSTLLRTLAGVYPPSTGRMWTQGVVAPIFSPQVGFVPNASGFENIFLRGMLLGMSREEVASKANEIRAFADIGDWIYEPVATYSSGMALRLAFAVCTSMRPDILLIDEWIGAGDALFMQKAGERLANLVSSVEILVLASHRDSILRQFCNQGIVLDRGAIVFQGSVSDAIAFHGELVRLYAESGRDARPIGDRVDFPSLGDV